MGFHLNSTIFSLITQGTHRRSFFIVCIIACCLIFNSCNKDEIFIPEFTNSNTGPFLLNIEHLELIDSLKTDDPVLEKAYNDLRRGADSLLTARFSYVPEKGAGVQSPSGDPHDYVSLDRYAYPNNSTGAYTERRDGQTNPEFYNYDKPKLEKISYSVYALALAYYYSGKEKYAEKASEGLYNWFLNPQTRMNPNMKYASYRPGVPESYPGGSGIVGALDFIDMIEAASLLYDSPHWTSELHYELKDWFFEFYQWMYNQYPADAYFSSNVSTWLDVQRGIYLLFTEEDDKLNSSSHIQLVSERLGHQIEANGLQRNEASRGISQHYVYFNLKAYMKLSLLRKNHFNRAGHDRDWPVLESSGGLKAALDDIKMVILENNKPTLFSSDPDFRTCRYLEIFRPAAVVFNNSDYEEAAQSLINMGCRNPDILLTYPSLNELK